VQQVLCGVSTRKYARSLEEMPEAESSVGTSRSSVSRRFVARTRAQIDAFLSRPLGDLDLPVLMLDGTTLGRHLLIVALGIDREGNKHVLGVVEGTTESAAVCRGLLRRLIDRGLPVERRRLVVLDGSKGLAKAVQTTFGKWAVVQRCRVHKSRNILEHLPKHLRPWFQVRLRKIWKLEKADDAKRELLALAKELEREYPGAAGSLREGLEETLTVNRLGLSGALLRSLRSTNSIENLQGRMKDTARNVKRWRNGSMVLRWAVTGLMEAETRFRRVRGYRDLDQLEAGLKRLIQVELDKEALIA
jgi:transposase-like protein